jgi:iron(III) transport system substrate-binding protein
MADAEKSGSAYMQLNTFLTIYGDKQPGWDKFKDVFKNISVNPSSGAVPRFVNDGEAVVGITLEDNAYLYLKGGGPVAIVYPEDGTSVIADGMALVKKAPNPAGGKAFIDWALSAATQNLAVQELGRRPIRKDAKPLGALKPLEQIKLVKYDIKNAADKRKEYIDKWQGLVQGR